MVQGEFIQLRNAIDGVSYPATKNQLIEQARNISASDDVLSVLRGIPDREYDSPIEVSEAVFR